MLLVLPQIALGDYTSIQHNLTSPPPDTSFDGSVLRVHQSGFLQMGQGVDLLTRRHVPNIRVGELVGILMEPLSIRMRVLIPVLVPTGWITLTKGRR
jgi:hypothetical protein